MLGRFVCLRVAAIGTIYAGTTEAYESCVVCCEGVEILYPLSPEDKRLLCDTIVVEGLGDKGFLGAYLLLMDLVEAFPLLSLLQIF